MSHATTPGMSASRQLDGKRANHRSGAREVETTFIGKTATLPCNLPAGQGPMAVARELLAAESRLEAARTDFQSESDSRPTNRTSRCGRVTGNNLKYDAECNPAYFQS